MPSPPALAAASPLAVPPPDDAALIAAIEAELAPATALGGVLARRVGSLATRLERSGRQERAGAAERRRHAADRFDAARLDEVDRLMWMIAAHPAINGRALRGTAEGLERMLRTWRGLLGDLRSPVEDRWIFSHQMLAENLMGGRPEDTPTSRVQALSQTLWNNTRHLTPAEREGRDPKALRAWARGELDAILVERIADLEAELAAVDRDRDALDRAEAADRDAFDPGPAATLARKLDAATERSLFRTLREFREVEAGAATRAFPPAQPVTADQAETEPEADPAPRPGRPLGSSRQAGSAPPAPARPAPRPDRKLSGRAFGG